MAPADTSGSMFVVCCSQIFSTCCPSTTNPLTPLMSVSYPNQRSAFITQERIGRYTSQLMSLVSSSWLPIRTNALICLGNSLFFHEPNRRRVETTDGALLDLLG